MERRLVLDEDDALPKHWQNLKADHRHAVITEWVSWNGIRSVTKGNKKEMEKKHERVQNMEIAPFWMRTTLWSPCMTGFCHECNRLLCSLRPREIECSVQAPNTWTSRSAIQPGPKNIEGKGRCLAFWTLLRIPSLSYNVKNLRPFSAIDETDYGFRWSTQLWTNSNVHWIEILPNDGYAARATSESGWWCASFDI